MDVAVVDHLRARLQGLARQRLEVQGGSVLRWTDARYTDVVARPSGAVTLLTPPSTVAAILRGCTPRWQPSPHWPR